MIWITPGDIFVGAALVSRLSTYLVSTEAVRGSVVLVWYGPAIQALARRLPRLFENQERLAPVLVEPAPCTSRKIAGGMELDVTNEELAYSANITPYTTSRMIGEWQRSGAIRKPRGKVLLRSHETSFFRVV